MCHVQPGRRLSVSGESQQSIAVRIHSAGSACAIRTQRVLPSEIRCRDQLQPRQIAQSLGTTGSTHLHHRLQAGADRGAKGIAEQPAARVVSQMNASDSCWLSIGHAGNRRGNRRSDAARSTTGTAIHNPANCGDVRAIPPQNPQHPRHWSQSPSRLSFYPVTGRRSVYG